MNPLRYIEKRIRGWLPKEPNLARRPLRIKAFMIKIRRRKPLTIRDRVVGGLGGGGGALVLMGILNYFLFPRYPKSYIAAEEVVGWLVVSLAFFVWITDKNKKINAEKKAPNVFQRGEP
jgi:hypothetical protein